MWYFTKKEQVIVVLLIVVIVLISLFNFLNKNPLIGNKENSEYAISENILMEMEEEEIDEDDEEIMVHISGEVYKPGIVVLKAGSRVIDAVNLAGGLKKDADLDKINLAKRLVDEEKIYIPKIGEDDIPIESSNVNSSTNNFDSPNGKVNINTCTKEELMTLPGIGEVLAQRIIEYRQGNPFRTIEDIMNVSGIGDKKFESIKDLITVK